MASRPLIASHHEDYITRGRRVPPPARGYTLLEILVVVSILAVVLGIGIPSFLQHRAERDLEGAQREMQAMFTLARSTAAAQNSQNPAPAGKVPVRMVFAGTAPGFSCTLSDTNGSKLRNYIAPSTVSVRLPSSVTTFNFISDGTIDVGGAFTSGSLVLNSTSTATVRQLTIYTTTGGVVLGP